MSSTNFASVSTTLVMFRDRLCIKHDVILKEMAVRLGKAVMPVSDYLHTMVDRIIRCASKEILITCRDTCKSLITIETKLKNLCT